METRHIIRSSLRGDYVGGPWGTSYNYSSETELISGTSTPEYKSQRIIVAESTGLWLIVVHFKLNGASTSAFEQWKQKNKVTPIVTNSAGTELTSHVWPSQITLGIPEHTHTVDGVETSGIEGFVVDPDYFSSLSASVPHASIRTTELTQLFWLVRLKTGDRCYFVRDPLGATQWEAEAIRLAPGIIESGIHI